MEVIYKHTNRANVVTFLTKHFGFKRAIHMYETQTIPSEACDIIIQKVISTPRTRTPDIDWTDEGILHDTNRYIQRTYNGQPVEIANLTEYDVRMIYTMNKLRNSYNAYKNGRKRTMLSSLNEIEKTRYCHPPQPKNTIVKNTLITQQASISETCRAVKMTGEKCTAKAKNGTGFCCRHGKK
jgi:hypothetical protein